MVSRYSSGLIMREQAASNDALHRGFIPKELVRELFLEWNVSKQCVTGAGGYYIPEYADGPDGAFYANELGFGRHNAERDIVQTSRYLASDNDARRDDAVAAHNDLIRATLARAPRSLVLKAILKPIDTPRGCTGCSSCTPGARLAPQPVVIKLEGSFDEWRPYTPGSLPRAIREQHAVASFLRTAAAAVRRARKQQRAAAYKARNDRNAGARSQMQARREEAKTVRRAARRALGIATTTRR